jgi:hypothetical protein
MENTKKVTKREYFERIREIVIEDKELVAFIDHELELLARKNSRNGTSKTQIENIKVAEMLVDELRKINKPMTITDLMNSSEKIKGYRLENGNALSNQKISAIFKQLVENKTLAKITEKKKSYFSIAK